MNTFRNIFVFSYSVHDLIKVYGKTQYDQDTKHRFILLTEVFRFDREESNYNEIALHFCQAIFEYQLTSLNSKQSEQYQKTIKSEQNKSNI